MTISHARMFVSYARGDFEATLGGPGRGAEMYQYLRQRLQIGDRRSLIQSLRDNENVVMEGDDYRDNLEVSMRDCDFALVILSQYYVKSPSCLWELEMLLAEGKPLHVAELENVRAIPELSEGTLRMLAEQKRLDYTRFWRRDQMGEDDILYGHPSIAIDEKYRSDFVESCDDLIKGLRNRARRVRLEALEKDTPATLCPRMDALERSEPVTSPAQKALEDTMRVFIAVPTTDVRREAERMANRLTKEGYVSVLPVLDDGYEKVEETLAAMMQGCALMIHFLGLMPGRRIGPQGETQVALQYRLAKEVDLPVLACRRDDILFEELGEDYQQVLAGLEIHETDFARFQSYALGMLDDMKREGLARAEEDRRKQNRRSRGLVNAPLVMIDGDETDRAHVEALSDIIGGLDAYALPIGYLDDIEESLKDAASRHDGAIIIFGQNPASRIRARRHFEKLLQDFACARNVRMQRMALGNDMGPNKSPPRGPGCDILTLYDGVKEEEVRDFVEKLRVRMDQNNGV